MRVRIGLARAAEAQSRKAAQTEILGEEPLLTGEDQECSQPAPLERMGDRRQLYGFGPGADDQPDLCGMQPSP
jgi:hypothetical protein